LVEFLILLVVGIVVGALARLLMPGRDPIGVIGTMVLGVLGTLGGYYIAAAIFKGNEGVPWIASVVVAMVLLFIYRKMTYGRRPVSR
jgi:uncharacterized membrane protein YeaQ/YmgE (transglycosylase-associated protein family)